MGLGVYQCPHCGEEVDSDTDSGAGREQEYIEDCPVCCRPNLIRAVYSPDDDAFWLDATGEV
jgi:hypothetical protein